MVYYNNTKNSEILLLCEHYYLLFTAFCPLLLLINVIEV